MIQFVEFSTSDKSQDFVSNFTNQGKNLAELGGLKLTSSLVETSKGVELEKYITSMFRLGTEVDLKHLKSGIRCSDIASSGKMLIGKLRDPSMTFTIFPSGACVCSFAKNEQESLLGARKVANLIKKLGYNVKFSNYQILNVSYRFSLDRKPDFENMMQLFKNFEAKYEPEVSEELTLKIEQTLCVFFKNGSVVISGAKSEDHADFVYNIILYTISTDFSQSAEKDNSEASTESQDFFETDFDSAKKFFEYI